MFSNTTATWAEAEVFCLYNVLDWTKEVNQFIDLKKSNAKQHSISFFRIPAFQSLIVKFVKLLIDKIQ